MKRNKLLSLIMALSILLSLVPAANALSPEPVRCPTCNVVYARTVLKEATCQESGVNKYICPTCKTEVLWESPKDPTNHVTVCVDTGDGATHTATCRYCEAYKNIPEPHNFENGYCAECGAVDYAEADIVMTDRLEVYVGLNDTAAAISAGDIAVMVGSVDVTDEYTISYIWMENGKVVGSEEEYTLPDDKLIKEGDYTYGCIVMATPEDLSGAEYISRTCTITVHVRDLVTADATVNADGREFTLGSTNARTEVSVAQQIYNAAYDLAKGYPSYVVFGDKPVSKVGDLLLTASRYYFDPSGIQLGLSSLVFVPTENASGSYTIPFTVVDTEGDEFPGVLTILVERNIGFVDLVYVTTQGKNVTLSSKDFEAFWNDTYEFGELALIYINDLPTIKAGTLYYNWSDYKETGDRIATSDRFYSNYYAGIHEVIDGLTFVPYTKFTGTITIPFEAFGTNNQGKNCFLEGYFSVFVSTGDVENVRYSVSAGEYGSLDGDDFLEVYRATTGTKAENFSIKLLDVPAYGQLYLNYTGTVRDRALTEETLVEYTFHYNNAVSTEIDDLTYVSTKNTKDLTDTMRYVAYDSKGEFAFVGEIDIVTKKVTVTYTKYFTDVPKTSATEWYYTQVMDLAEAGIINGDTPTTFNPDGEVKYGEALKLIMLAAGYDVPIQTGTHWASGYLTVAQRDGLISTAVTEAHLDSKITRNMIASIAAKALKLPASSLTVSPFADVGVNSTYAPYILSLYEAGILVGSTNSKGETVYYGVNSIRRSEISVIIWRINNYTA